MTIETGIPSVRKPGRYINIKTAGANSALPANVQKMLIIAQMTDGATPENLPVQVFSDEEAGIICGKGSIAHLASAAAIKANKYLALTILPVKDSTSTPGKSVRTLTVGGTATAAGSLIVSVGSFFRFEIGVAKDAVEADTASALLSAMAAEEDLPFVVTGATVDIVLTAKNAGTVANEIPIVVSSAAAGVTLTKVDTTEGAVDPILTDALANVFPERFHVIASTLRDAPNVTLLKDYIESVSDALEQRRGQVFFGQSADANISDTQTLASTINDGRLNVIYYRGSSSASFEICAAFASIWAGEEDPALPLNTVELAGIIAPAIQNRFSRAEIESLLHNGVTPLEVAPDGVTAQVVRSITTYTLNASGSPDPTLLDSTTFKSLDYTSDAVRARLDDRFARAKNNELTRGAIRAEVLDVLFRLEAIQVLQNVAEYADEVVVEVNPQDVTRADVRIPAPIVPGLHVLAGIVELKL